MTSALYIVTALVVVGHLLKRASFSRTMAFGRLTLYLRNRLGIGTRYFIPFGLSVLACPLPPLLAENNAQISLTSFGVKPNDTSSDGRQALLTALKALFTKGGGVLQIPAGDFYLNFPDIATDIYVRDPASRPMMLQKKLSPEKLIVIPSNVEIIGAIDSKGKPLTRLHWRETSFPLLSFVNSNHSGLSNISFIFDGTQPHFFPWLQEDYLDAVGVGGGGIGSPSNISTVIYTIGSDNLKLNNLAFASSKEDNQHAFANGIVANGKAMIRRLSSKEQAALPMAAEMRSGLTECTAGNVISHVDLSDFINGLLISGQCDMVIEDIHGNKRGSWFQSFDPVREKGNEINSIGGPGHLIYIAPQFILSRRKTPSRTEGEVKVSGNNANKNLTIRNVTEGPDTLSNFNSSGTLALKAIFGATVDNVHSLHPVGLIDGMIDTHNVKLTNLAWEAHSDYCASVGSPPHCYYNSPAVILAAGNAAQEGTNEHITFKNMSLKSPYAAMMIALTSPRNYENLNHDIMIDNLTLEFSPTLKRGQLCVRAMIQVEAKDTRLISVNYTPIVGTPAQGAGFNTLVDIQRRSVNATVDLTIHRPQAPLSDDAYKSIVDPVALNNRCAVTQRFIQ